MSLALSSSERIDAWIVVLRGRRVMISTDLAKLYGVEPRALVQAVKRNAHRLPPDFMFLCTPEEAESVRASKSQTVILKRGANIKHASYAVTQEAVATRTLGCRRKQVRRPRIARATC